MFPADLAALVGANALRRSPDDIDGRTMTSHVAVVGSFGLWTPGAISPADAAVIESFGCGTVWAGFSPAADLGFAEPLLERTDNLRPSANFRASAAGSAPSPATGSRHHPTGAGGLSNARRLAQRRELTAPTHLRPLQRPWYQPDTYRDVRAEATVPIDDGVLLGPGAARTARRRCASPCCARWRCKSLTDDHLDLAAARGEIE